MPEANEPRLVVLDANVLANIHVCDLLLRLAEEPTMYRPFWSERILDEVQTTHAKLTWKPEFLITGAMKYSERFQVQSLLATKILRGKLRSNPKIGMSLPPR